MSVVDRKRVALAQRLARASHVKSARALIARMSTGVVVIEVNATTTCDPSCECMGQGHARR